MSRGRRRLVKALVIVGTVFAFLAIFGIWIERQALNTDDWVNTSDKLIANTKIREAVADYLVNTLYENVDVEKELEGILPGETKELAGPVSGAVRSVAGTGANEVLQTSRAQDLWRAANRTAHEELLAVLKNEHENVSTGEGEVTLNLSTLVTNLANEVGIGQSLAEKLPENAGRIVILRSNQLKTAQRIATAIQGLALVMTLLTFLFFGLAIWLSREDRWVTVLFCGIGLIVAGFAVIVFRSVAGGIVIDQLVTEETIKPAAEEAWSIATSLMVSIAITVIIFGVLFGVAGWLASPTSPAKSTRRVLTPFLRDYTGWVYALLGIVVCIYFLSAPTQNLRSFLTALLLAGLAAAGIHELRRQSEHENPDVQLDDIFGHTRRRVVGAVQSANIGERVEKLRLPEMRKGGGAPGTAAGGEQDTRLARLEKLADLKDKGVLTEEEFQAEKARAMGESE
ncbi:MAG TPA: SHOCT domain-containing protein [Solirubrobacterales bacterium]